jgi:hypothetical protein
MAVPSAEFSQYKLESSFGFIDFSYSTKLLLWFYCNKTLSFHLQETPTHHQVVGVYSATKHFTDWKSPVQVSLRFFSIIDITYSLSEIDLGDTLLTLGEVQDDICLKATELVLSWHSTILAAWYSLLCYNKLSINLEKTNFTVITNSNNKVRDIRIKNIV